MPEPTPPRLSSAKDRFRSGVPGVLGESAEVAHGARQVFWGFQSALDERLVDNHLGCHVRQFTSLPRFHLLSHGLEVALHSINTHRDAVDERERFECFASTGVKSPANAMFEHTNTR
jgi:hypothetical protein